MKKHLLTLILVLTIGVSLKAQTTDTTYHVIYSNSYFDCQGGVCSFAGGLYNTLSDASEQCVLNNVGASPCLIDTVTASTEKNNNPFKFRATNYFQDRGIYIVVKSTVNSVETYYYFSLPMYEPQLSSSEHSQTFEIPKGDLEIEIYPEWW